MTKHIHTPPLDDTVAAIGSTEFLKRFPISEAHFLRLVKKRRIRTLRFGKKILIPIAEVHRLLEEGVGSDAA